MTIALMHVNVRLAKLMIKRNFETLNLPSFTKDEFLWQLIRWLIVLKTSHALTECKCEQFCSPSRFVETFSRLT